MNDTEGQDDRLAYIRDTLSDLSRIANAQGYQMLSHLIGMACLEAWELERGLTNDCEQQEEEEQEDESDEDEQ